MRQMPRRPRIARLEVNGIKIDVYDRETLFTLLEILGRDGKPDKADKQHKFNKERKLHKAVKEFKEDKSGKDPYPKVSAGLPSFAEDNPWLKVIKKRRGVSGANA